MYRRKCGLEKTHIPVYLTQCMPKNVLRASERHLSFFCCKSYLRGTWMGEVNPSVTVPPKKMKIVFISGRFLLTLVMLFYQFFTYLKANLESLAREQLHPSGVNLSVIYVLHPTVTGNFVTGLGP